MRYSNKQTTPPASEPVTVTELDTHLRGDGELETNESSYLTSLITAAREHIENETHRAMINQTWTLYMDAWPTVRRASDDWWDGVREGALSSIGGSQRFVELPVAPLVSVTSVKTFDGENVSSTFASSNYFLDTNSVLGRVVLNNGTVWPVVTRNLNGIEIIYVAGYGASATSVPGALKQAVLQLAAHWYENREYVKTQSDMNQATTPLHVQRIINQWKVMKL